jgi:SAM-dependent methyltransferase
LTAAAGAQRYSSSRTLYREFEQRALRRIVDAGGLVVDAGGGERFTKDLARYEPWFEGVEYRTLDVSEATGPDIVGDIHELPFESGSVDAFLCRSVLEHVASPPKAVEEMWRVLKPGGQLFLTVPSIYPYHARKGPAGYPDFWRFFEDTLRMLLEPFAEVEVGRSGGPARAVMIFLPPLNNRASRIGRQIDRIDKRLEGRVFRTNCTFLLAWARK